MNFLITPDTAFFLLVSGTIVLIVALLTPGTGLLEFAAVVLLLSAGYGATQLETNPWAVGIWLLGIVFFVLSVRRSRHAGVWFALALLTIMVGSVFIFRSPAGGSAVSPWLAATVSVLGGGAGWFVTRKVLEAETQPPAHDLNRLIGRVGEARTDIAREGTVYVAGELWTARSAQPIPAGSVVKVVGRDGLVLVVRPETQHSFSSIPGEDSPEVSK